MSGRGWLIVFEGIDGTGKSTQCKKMEVYLNKIGIAVSRFREPTDGVWGQKIRKILTVGRGDVTREEELSWFIEDRREEVKNNIPVATCIALTSVGNLSTTLPNPKIT